MTQTSAHTRLYVPEATPAAADLVCWLWAAYPPKEGRLHIARIARDLGVSTTTLRRWIRDADQLEFDHHTAIRLHQRAILRGRGHYLWPDLDPASRARGPLLLRNARTAHQLISHDPARVPPAWRRDGTTDPHRVHLVHYRRAHAYGVATTRITKSVQRLQRYGDILRSITVPDRFAATISMQLTLSGRDDARCITPRAMIPSGHTNTWREIAGPARLHRPPKPDRRGP